MPFNARITVPAEAKAGEIVEIRVLTRHPMDRGGQSDGNFSTSFVSTPLQGCFPPATTPTASTSSR